MNQLCPTCEGSKYLFGTGYMKFKCPMCEGKGYVTQVVDKVKKSKNKKKKVDDGGY